MEITNKNLIQLVVFSAVLGSGASYSSVYVFHLALIMLCLFHIICIQKNNGKIMYKKCIHIKIHYFLYGMFIWYSITLLWSADILISLKYLCYIFLGILLTMIILRFSISVEKQHIVFRTLAIVFGIEMFLCLLEIFTPIRWPISPYSPYVYLFGQSGTNFTLLNSDVIDNLLSKPTGFAWNSNNLALHMTIILPYFLLAKNKLYKYCGSGVVFFILISTSSRGNFVAGFVILLLYLFLFSGRSKLNNIVHTIIVLLLFSGFMYGLSYINNANIQRVLGTALAVSRYFDDTQELDSVGIRHQLIINGIHALEESNGLGIGAGNSVLLGGGEDTKNVGSMHNFWIEILVDAGVVFGIIFFIWYIVLILILYKINKKSNNKWIKYYSGATFLSLSGFVFGSISASSVIYVLPMWILIGFALATINNYQKGEERNE